MARVLIPLTQKHSPTSYFVIIYQILTIFKTLLHLTAGIHGLGQGEVTKHVNVQRFNLSRICK